MLHDIEGRHYGFYVHFPLREFLDSLGRGAKILIHFQGRGRNDIGTAVISVDDIGWVREENCPYLILEDPKALRPIHDSLVLWATFILAIALVPFPNEVPVMRDDDDAEFIRLATRQASSLAS